MVLYNQVLKIITRNKNYEVLYKPKNVKIDIC